MEIRPGEAAPDPQGTNLAWDQVSVWSELISLAALTV